MAQASDLEQLAQPLFGGLSRAERTMVEGAVGGRVAYCGANDKPDDPLNDPKDSDSWDQERRIRAELLRWLCADEGAKKLVDPRGIRIDSAWIEGEISLSFLEIPFQVGLTRCRLKDACRLNLSEVPRVDLTGSWVEFIGAEHAVVKGDFVLKSVVCVGRGVGLNGARIGGSLNCDGGRFENPVKKDVASSGIALNGDAIRVGGAVLFREHFTAQGTVRLFNAQIDGNLECDGGQFINPPQVDEKRSGIALNIEGAKIGGSVQLRGSNKTGEASFVAKGVVRLYRAQIGGDLVCDGGLFENPAQRGVEASGIALHAGATRITGGVFLRSGFYGRRDFAAKGAVVLFGAQIGGSLECDGGKFENPAETGTDGSGVAVRANGVNVTGSVLLRKAFSAKGTVVFYNARIGGSFDCDGGTFENAAQKGIAISGTALNAGAAKIAGGVLMRSGFYGRGDFSAKGVVWLYGAQIEGNLECDGSKFENVAQAGMEGTGLALQAYALSVTGSVFLRKRFSAKGGVSLYGARIGGNLDCDGGTFENAVQKGIQSAGTALNVGTARVAGGFFLRSNFYGKGACWAKGAVRLYGAQIEGNLECDGSTFENPALADTEGSGVAFSADSASVTGDVTLRGFHSRGSVNLYNARIGGSLNCDGGTFENAAVKDVANSGTAMNASAARVGGGVLMRSYFSGRGSFSAKGTVWLQNAQIEGSLECDGSKFENPGQEGVRASGVALHVDMARVVGSVLLRQGFSANGMVRLYGAQIGGNLGCSKGTFRNEGVGVLAGRGIALLAGNVKVTGDVLLNQGFEAKDAVTLGKARIGGRLESNGGKFHSLDLADASAAAIVDDVDDKEWTSETRLNLDGFAYERISKVPPTDPLDQAIEELAPAGEESDIEHRLKWLRLQKKFTRQPYRRLAKVLKDSGDDRGFRKVCMRMEERALEGRSWWRRFTGHVLGATIGYGYASQRAVYWVLGLILLGTIVYWHGRRTMVPTQKDAYSEFVTNGDPPPYYGRFHAVAYSIDNSFPLVKLGIQDKWAPRERAAQDTALPAGWLQWIEWRTCSPGFLRCFRWGQICVGWILTTLFAVGVSGLIRKD